MDYENSNLNYGCYLIHWMCMTDYENQNSLPDAEVPYEYKIDSSFIGSDPGVFSSSYNDGIIYINYNKPAGYYWSFAFVDLQYPITSYTRIYFDVDFTDNTNLILKLEGSEQSFEFNVSTSGTHYFDLVDYNLEGINKVILFPSPGQENVSGIVVIKDLIFQK
jgi:hypothetical protein